MRRRVAILSLVLLAALAPAAGRAQQGDPAETAWARGDHAEAERLYRERLAADSTDALALHRLALILAWSQRYDESLTLYDRLVDLSPENLEARVDRARVLAWKGDPRAAVAQLDPLLARNPGFLPALQARAQFLSWAGEFDAALSAYERVLEITPEDRTTAFDRARVLSWASRFQAAEEVYAGMLRADPSDREALLGLAQVLAWSSRMDSASVLYRRVLERDPADVEALRGLARAASWGGRLVEGERRWRDALRAHPSDVPSLVGLGQTLRWQGRDAAALEVLREARRVAPTDRDVQEQLLWADRATRPRASSGVVYETDSDGNRIVTTLLSGAARLRPRLEVRGEFHLREADFQQLGPRSWGGAVTAWQQLEPGWGLSATVGASFPDVPGADPIPTLRLGVETPGRYRVRGGLSYARAALEGTALLIERQVATQEVAASVRGRLLGLQWGGGAAVAEYEGRVSGQENRRVGGEMAVSRVLLRTLTLGAGVRAFGFERDLSDGYFDPDFYGLAEATARWAPQWGRWLLELEGAPGMQQVRSDGDPSASIRASGRVAYLFAPGRQVAITFGFANSGLHQLSPGASADYQYRALGISGSWGF